MQIVEALAAVVTLLSLIFFAVFLTGLTRLPKAGRPRTPTVDRFGNPLAPRENPDFRETEEESHSR